MIANHIHDALSQVRKLQEFILQRRIFRGYSGTARLLGGLTALAGAMILSAEGYPDTALAHLAGWGIVLGGGLLINYGGLLLWFFYRPDVRRDVKKLLPAFDAIPALAVGGILTVALVMHGQYRFLFGAWMSLYGLAHIPYRNSLPRANYAVGIAYILMGALCLLHPGTTFTNPWPMGLTFAIGETAGGLILYRLNHEDIESNVPN